MILFPNAKINIGLAVTEKRRDGYHNIESVFVPVPICDTLEIIPSKEFQFKTFGLTIEGKAEHNLCIKAYKLLKNDFDLPPVEIVLFKNIPMGAGLGGGSSDAAYTLIALNKIFDLKLTDSQLVTYASKTGSDCSFFIYNTPCFAEQKGEKMTPVSVNLTNYYIKLIKTSVHISTADAYKNIFPHKTTISFKKIVEEKPMEEWKNYLYNDFETQAFSNYPILKSIKEKLYNEGALYASMTGSGSAIYGIFDSIPAIDKSIDFCQIAKL